MSSSPLKLSEIEIDGGTQPRTEIDETVVAEYAEAMKAGAVFPPIVVFSDGKHNWLADGFHRYHGAARNGSKEIRCDVRRGTRQNARDYACSGEPNAKHGKRETPADRHQRIATMIEDHPDWSNVDVAKWCSVSEFLVRQVKKSIFDKNEDARKPDRTVKRGDTTYTMNTANIGKRPDTETQEETVVVDRETGEVLEDAAVVKTTTTPSSERKECDIPDSAVVGSYYSCPKCGQRWPKGKPIHA